MRKSPEINVHDDSRKVNKFCCRKSKISLPIFCLLARKWIENGFTCRTQNSAVVQTCRMLMPWPERGREKKSRRRLRFQEQEATARRLLRHKVGDPDPYLSSTSYTKTKMTRDADELEVGLLETAKMRRHLH